MRRAIVYLHVLTSDKTKSFSCFWKQEDVRYSASKENLSIKLQSVGTTSVRGYDSLKVLITQILIKITGSITIKCRCFSIGTCSIIETQVYLMQHMVLRVAHKLNIFSLVRILSGANSYNVRYLRDAEVYLISA